MMKAAFIGLTAAVMATGCMTQERELDGYGEDMEYFDEGDFYEGNVDATSGWIAGDVGDMRGLDESAEVGGYDEGDYTTLEVLTTNGDGSAMHRLDFYGGLEHPALRPGNTLVFQGGNYPESNSQIHVEAMACSGAEAYAWDYDDSADRVEMEVFETEDPEVVEVTYTTYVADKETFGIGEDDVSQGRFRVNR